MAGLFSRQAAAAPDWAAEMEENRLRWFVFIEKLEARMDELCSAALPELQQVLAEDQDAYKRTYLRVQAGIKGQLGNIREKIREVGEEKVLNFFNCHIDEAWGNDALRQRLYAFREACTARENAFETRYSAWMDRLEKTGQRDLEAEYRSILEEHAALRDSFCCRQCGAPVAVDKVYFITSYLVCSHCRTQNTFEPGSKARGLDGLARELAEARTAHLLAASEAERQRERDLYMKIHENRARGDDTPATAASRKAQNEVWQTERETAIRGAHVAYETYLRAMFDEWNSIVPDLAEHNERFYQRMLEDYRRSC